MRDAAPATTTKSRALRFLFLSVALACVFFGAMPLKTLDGSRAAQVQALWIGTAGATFEFGLFLLLFSIWFLYRRARTMLYLAWSCFFGGAFLALNAAYAAGYSGPLLDVPYTVSAGLTLIFLVLYFEKETARQLDAHGIATPCTVPRLVYAFIVLRLAGMAATIVLQHGDHPLFPAADRFNRAVCGLAAALVILHVCFAYLRTRDAAFRAVAAAAVVYGAGGLRDLLTTLPSEVLVVQYVSVGSLVTGAILFIGIAAEYRKTQKKLALWNAELKAAVEARTRELHDSEAKRRRMIADLAHDLRTPAAAVSGAIDVLKTQPLPADAQAVAETASWRAQQLKDRLDDLFELARLESGLIKLETARLPAAKLLATLFAHYESEIRQRSGATAAVRLELPAGTETLVIDVDFDRIWQVFDNLVANACRHAEGDTPDLTFGLARRGGEAVFYLEDKGTGIAPELLPHIFERSFSARREEKPGSGLGLAIAKALVELHGGTIWCESAAGRGSRFLFSLAADE